MFLRAHSCIYINAGWLPPFLHITSYDFISSLFARLCVCSPCMHVLCRSAIMSMDNSRPAKRVMSTISNHSEEPEEAEEDEIRSGNLCEINELQEM